MAPEGWHTGEQIRDHKLVASIINGHHDKYDEVMGPPELELLQRFSADPSMSTRDAILSEHDWVDDPDQRPGTKAAEKSGSLAGCCIARHGTDIQAFDERDLEMLREWFGRGMPEGERVHR